MSAPALTVEGKLAAARFLAKQQMPYLGVVLLSLVPREAPGLDTIGVTKDGFMLYDPVAVMRWGTEELAGVLVHECFHVILRHHKRFASVAPEYQRVANVATDLAINPMIKAAGLQLPADGQMPSVYGFAENLSAEEYLDLLLKRQQKGSPKGKGQKGKAGAGAPGDGDGDGLGANKPGAGSGWCGSCAGREVPNEPKGEGTRGEERTEPELNRIARAAAEAISQEAAKGRGTIPGHMVRWAEEFCKPPKVRWQDKLARAARGAVAYRAGAQDYTYALPNRHMLGSWAPGMPLLPAMCAVVPRGVVLVDTSGSMGAEDLSIAVRETRGALLQTGADIEFGATDAALHTLKPVRNWKDVLPLLVGGGGTDFRPALEALTTGRGNGRRKPKPDFVIFITDGDGPAPAQCPPGLNVVWLLVGKHHVTPYAGNYGGGKINWGTIIEVDD